MANLGPDHWFGSKWSGFWVQNYEPDILKRTNYFILFVNQVYMSFMYSYSIASQISLIITLSIKGRNESIMCSEKLQAFKNLPSRYCGLWCL